ncbi:unnamed protein product [Amoebophrya sp. A120]|nr:unnamed protein product [Amoebophrya sp. A120]|eukprot:GSA120T00016241001.1
MATSKAKTTTRRDSSARKTTNPNPGPLPLLDTEVASGSRRPEEDDSIAPPVKNTVAADSTTLTSSGDGGDLPSTKKKKKKSLVLKTRSVRRTRKIRATVGVDPEQDGAADNMVQEAPSATGGRKSLADSPKNNSKKRLRQLQEKHGELMETDEIFVPEANENIASNQVAAAPVSPTPSPEPGQQRTSNLKSAKNKLSAFTKMKTVEQYTRVNTSFEDQKGEKNYAPGKSKPAVYDTQTAFERGADWDPMHDSEDDGQLHEGNFVTSENKKLSVPGDYTSEEEFPRAAAEEEEEDNEITRGFDSSDENNPFANVRRRFGESQKINEDHGEGEVLQWDRSRFDKNNNVGKIVASSGGLQQPVIRPSTTIFTSADQEERLPDEEESDNRQPAFRGSYGFGASRPVEAAKQLAEAGRASLNFAIGSVSSMLSLGDEAAPSAMRGSIDFGGVKGRPMGASLVYNVAGEGEGLADVENGSNYYMDDHDEINSIEDDDDIAPRFTHLHEFLSGLDLSDHAEEDIPPPTRRPVAAEGEAVNFGVEITAGANSGTTSTGRTNANKIMQPEGERSNNKIKPNYMMANKLDNKNNLVIKGGQEKESQRSVSTPRRKAPLDMGRGKKATEGTKADSTSAVAIVSGGNALPSALAASAVLDKENTMSSIPVAGATSGGVKEKVATTVPTTPPTTSQQLQQVSTLASQVSHLDDKVNLIATEQIPRLEDQIAAVNEGVHQHGITIADCMTAVVEQLQQVQNIETSLESEVAEGARNNSLLSAATGASKGLTSKMNKLSGITQNRGARANKGIIGRGGGNNYKSHHLLKPSSKLTPRSRKKKAEGEARIDEEEEEAQSEEDPQLEGFDDEDVGQQDLPTTPDPDDDRSIEKSNQERSSGVQPYEVERVLDFVYSEGGFEKTFLHEFSKRGSDKAARHLHARLKEFTKPQLELLIVEMCLQKAEEDPAKEKEAEQEIARAEADQLKRELVKLRERTDDLEMDLARAKNDNEELKDTLGAIQLAREGTDGDVIVSRSDVHILQEELRMVNDTFGEYWRERKLDKELFAGVKL